MARFACAGSDFIFHISHWFGINLQFTVLFILFFRTWLHFVLIAAKTIILTAPFFFNEQYVQMVRADASFHKLKFSLYYVEVDFLNVQLTQCGWRNIQFQQSNENKIERQSKKSEEKTTVKNGVTRS